MRHDREWGDNVEIYALAELTGRPVEIYSADAPHADPLHVVATATTVPTALYPPAAATLGPDAPADVPAAAAMDGDDDGDEYGDDAPQPPIRLAYHGGKHYNSVIHETLAVAQRWRDDATLCDPRAALSTDVFHSTLAAFRGRLAVAAFPHGGDADNASASADASASASMCASASVSVKNARRAASRKRRWEATAAPARYARPHIACDPGDELTRVNELLAEITRANSPATRAHAAGLLSHLVGVHPPAADALRGGGGADTAVSSLATATSALDTAVAAKRKSATLALVPLRTAARALVRNAKLGAPEGLDRWARDEREHLVRAIASVVKTGDASALAALNTEGALDAMVGLLPPARTAGATDGGGVTAASVGRAPLPELQVSANVAANVAKVLIAVLDARHAPTFARLITPAHAVIERLVALFASFTETSVRKNVAIGLVKAVCYPDVMARVRKLRGMEMLMRHPRRRCCRPHCSVSESVAAQRRRRGRRRQRRRWLRWVRREVTQEVARSTDEKDMMTTDGACDISPPLPVDEAWMAGRCHECSKVVGKRGVIETWLTAREVSEQYAAAEARASATKSPRRCGRRRRVGVKQRGRRSGRRLLRSASAIARRRSVRRARERMTNHRSQSPIDATRTKLAATCEDANCEGDASQIAQASS